MYGRATGVSHELSGDKVVILDAKGSTMFTLNPVGSMIWIELGTAKDASMLADTLIERFSGVSRDQLEADIEIFLDDLFHRGLAERV